MNRIRPLLRLAALAGFAVSLASCQSMGRSDLITSSVQAGLSPASATDIADDLANALDERIDRGTTIVRLMSEGSIFADALETTLKARGYAVSREEETLPQGKLMRLAYTVEPLDDGIMARLATPVFDLTRIYSLEGEGARPKGPLSIATTGRRGSHG